MRRSDDPVDEKLMSQAHKEIEQVLTRLFGKYPDGDPKVQFILTDRTRCLPMHFLNVHYAHKARSTEELREIVQRCMANVKIATDRLDVELRCLADEEKRIERDNLIG